MVGARVRYRKGSALRSSRRTRPLFAVARLFGRLLLVTLIGGAVVTVMSSPASAHGQLAMTTPAKDSTVKAPMEAVLLYFTEPPKPNSYFTVFTPSGVRVDRPWTSAEPKRLDEPVREDHLIDGVWEPRLFYMGYPAKIPVAYWPEQGVYTARYMTVASDGEPVRGEVRFTYMGTMSPAPKGWRAPTNQPDASVAAPAGHDGGTTADPQTGGTTAGPQAGGTVSATPTASCIPRSMPETGCQTGSSTTVPATSAQPPAQTSAQTSAAESDSGTGVLVWLVPAVLVAGTGFMVIRAARRPSPDGGGNATRRTVGTPGRSPLAQRADTPRKAPRKGQGAPPRGKRR